MTRQKKSFSNSDECLQTILMLSFLISSNSWITHFSLKVCHETSCHFKVHTLARRPSTQEPWRKSLCIWYCPAITKNAFKPNYELPLRTNFLSSYKKPAKTVNNTQAQNFRSYSIHSKFQACTKPICSLAYFSLEIWTNINSPSSKDTKNPVKKRTIEHKTEMKICICTDFHSVKTTLK